MAITKKFKVSFDLTLKVGSEEEQQLAAKILEIAKAVGEGQDVPHHTRELLVQALTGGPDAAAAFIVRSSIREGIKKMFDDLGDAHLFKVSPATVRVIK